MTRGMKSWRRFESLESRTMLAADVVNATVNNHNLSILAGGSGYDFVVSGDGTAGDVVITGYADQTSGAGTKVDGTENGVPVAGTPVLGFPDAQIKLTGVTGNITINLGAGGVAVNVENLTVEKDLSIATGDGNEGIMLDSLTVSGNTSIVGGSGNLSIQLGAPASNSALGDFPGADVNIAGNLSISAGNGNDEVFENFLTVGGNQSINLGAGNNSVGLDDLVSGVAFATVRLTPVQPLATSPNISIRGNLTVQMGSGNSNFDAIDTKIGGTLLVTGGAGLSVGGNINSDVLAAEAVVTTATNHGNHGYSAGTGRPAPVSASSADDITLNGVSASAAEIFTGIADTDTVKIEGSSFKVLGVALGSGKGELSIGTTTTTTSTTLIGLGTSNTYDDLGSNSFANLYTQGLTSPPTATPPLTPPVVQHQSGRHTWQ